MIGKKGLFLTPYSLGKTYDKYMPINNSKTVEPVKYNMPVVTKFNPLLLERTSSP